MRGCRGIPEWLKPRSLLFSGSHSEWCVVDHAPPWQNSDAVCPGNLFSLDGGRVGRMSVHIRKLIKSFHFAD